MTPAIRPPLGAPTAPACPGGQQFRHARAAKSHAWATEPDRAKRPVHVQCRDGHHHLVARDAAETTTAPPRPERRGAARRDRNDDEQPGGLTMVATTPSGQVITCDGCGAPVEEVRENMKHPVLYPHQWAEPDVIYIVCAPLPDGTQPCLDLARLNDELFETTKCRVPGCRGDRCHTANRTVR